MNEFFKSLKALHREPNEDGPVNKKGSAPWEWLELLMYVVIAIIAAAGIGLHKLAVERAMHNLPAGCPPACASAQLAGFNLREAELDNADLHGADLSQAQLSPANLSNADLRGADLRSYVVAQIE